jgi:hypothetical protein
MTTRQRQQTRISMVLILAALLLLAGCTPTIFLGPVPLKPAFKFAFQPTGVPVVVAIDTQGNISAEPTASFQTPLGRFSVEFSTNIIDPVLGTPGPSAPHVATPESGVPPEGIPRPDGARLLILRDRNEVPDRVDSVYPLDLGFAEK